MHPAVSSLVFVLVTVAGGGALLGLLLDRIEVAGGRLRLLLAVGLGVPLTLALIGLALVSR